MRIETSINHINKPEFTLTEINLCLKLATSGLQIITQEFIKSVDWFSFYKSYHPLFENYVTQKDILILYDKEQTIGYKNARKIFRSMIYKLFDYCVFKDSTQNLPVVTKDTGNELAKAFQFTIGYRFNEALLYWHLYKHFTKNSGQ